MWQQGQGKAVEIKEEVRKTGVPRPAPKPSPSVPEPTKYGMFSSFGLEGASWKEHFIQKKGHVKVLEDMLGLVEEKIPQSVRVNPYIQGVRFIVTLEDTLKIPHVDVDNVN